MSTARPSPGDHTGTDDVPRSAPERLAAELGRLVGGALERREYEQRGQPGPDPDRS